MFEKRYKISLIFNANKVFDRGVIRGIGEYLQASQCDWDVYIEEDFRSDDRSITHWLGDGVIADFDNPKVESLLSGTDSAVVGVGGSYTNVNDYPKMPYVATDNYELVHSAFKHLKEKGIENFAFYGLPEKDTHRWAKEREIAFKKITEKEGFSGAIYSGFDTKPENWNYTINRLADWLQQFSEPTGIIAVTDARARHLLQVCDHLNN